LNTKYIQGIFFEFEKHLTEFKKKNSGSNNIVGLYMNTKYYENLKDIKEIKELKKHLGL